MWFRYLGSGALFFIVSFSCWNPVLANEGELDPSFGTGGKSSADITGQLLDDAVGDVALLSDGRILVAGTTSTGSPSEHDLAVAVFRTDGSLDESFGQLGRILIDLGGDDFCNAVSVQSDGRILLGGYRTAVAGTPPESVVVCLNPDGAIDTTFGTNGALEPAPRFAVVDLAVLSDGSIVAAGVRPSPDGSDFAIARLTSSGTVDETFGPGGVVFLDFGADDFLTQLSVDAENRLLVVGLNTAGGLELARLLSDGSPDPTFNGSGRRVIDYGCSYDVSVVIQPDQKILLGTTVSGAGGLSNFLLARLNPDGTADLQFGTGSLVSADLTGTDDYLTCLTLQPDGKILAVGWAGFYPDFLVQRYQIDGSVDQSFGSGGWIHTDFIGDKDRARVAVVQPDGRFLLAGDVPGSDFDESRDFGIARYDVTAGQQANAPRVTSRSVRSGGRARSDSLRR
jgi:uncharacterized delta-60 repeat protein